MSAMGEATSGEVMTSRPHDVERHTPDATRHLRAAWLAEQRSENTKRAYSRDLDHFAAFLADHGVTDVLATQRAYAAAWAEDMRRTVRDDGTRSISEATIARRLSAVSSFLSYA